jgi:hypothetical protein
MVGAVGNWLLRLWRHLQFVLLLRLQWLLLLW